MTSLKIKTKQFEAFKKPKVCVPLVGRNKEELLEELALLEEQLPDCVEWRIDWFEAHDRDDQLLMLELIRANLDASVLVLITFRTEIEGGNRTLSTIEYVKMYQEMLATGLVDIVDIEWRLGKDVISEIMMTAREYKVFTILSYHNFVETPSAEQLDMVVEGISNYAPDFIKVVTMANSDEDYPRLATFSKKWSNEQVKSLMIVLAMGEKGQGSRLNGHRFGSVLTFAKGPRASAPGQLTVREVYDYLNKLTI